MASGASSNEKTPDHLPRQNEMSSASPAVEQSAAESSLAAEAQSPQEAADSEHDVVRRGRRTVDFAIAGDQLNDKKPIPSDYETSPGNTSNEHITTRSRSSSSTSGNSSHVDWNQLQKNEDQEARDENSDDGTALLLARLECENAAIAIDPKSRTKAAPRTKARPMSIKHMRQLVEEQEAPAMPLSHLPCPPPLTELDFWVALVKDYTHTAQRLPTLTSAKIRRGVPPPLRGVVWASIARAGDAALEESFDRFSGEQSPYESIIGKDIGRSFPGVEMFREPNGEGQRMLATVLKCFSLYDEKIGYCQGLGFLVGPLLMHMGAKEAYCVLVRLMEDYGLRSCFLPDLSGLHLCIYQFQNLLQQVLPTLAAHLQSLQVEAAYLSQWFLSFFAVTCPLPLLFRIYDIMLVEGASETMMRVALSIMQKNEAKMMASREFEEVLQLLLSRALWDPFGSTSADIDDFVEDFLGLTKVVTRERLCALESNFKESQINGTAVKSGFVQEVQSTAASFLGRLRLYSGTSTKPASLTPPLTIPSRPVSVLRRSVSKQSIASTFNSVEGSSESSATSANTALTEDAVYSNQVSADGTSCKSTESMSFGPNAGLLDKDRRLHNQIEDLILALNELQREHALTEEQLQNQRDQRDEENRAVTTLLSHIREKSDDATVADVRRRTFHGSSLLRELTNTSNTVGPSSGLKELISRVEQVFNRDEKKSEDTLCREQLEEALRKSSEQLSQETRKSAELVNQLASREHELAVTKEQLKEARLRIQESHKEKQKLENRMKEMRNNTRMSTIRPDGLPSDVASSFTALLSRSTDPPSAAPSGLRELRLGRSAQNAGTTRPPSIISSDSLSFAPSAIPSNQQNPPRRISSLQLQPVPATSGSPSPISDEAMLLELVNAKTAEAVANQELEEWKRKFENLRKATQASAPAIAAAPAPSTSAISESPTTYQPHTRAFSQQAVSTTAMMVPTGTSNGSTASAKPATGPVGGGAFGFLSSWSRRTPSHANAAAAATAVAS